MQLEPQPTGDNGENRESGFFNRKERKEHKEPNDGNILTPRNWASRKGHKGREAVRKRMATIIHPFADLSTLA